MNPGRRYTCRLHTVSVVCEPLPNEPPHGEMAAGPIEGAEVARALLANQDPDQETFGVLFLSEDHRVIGFRVLALGSHAQCPVDAVRLFQGALQIGARGLIAFHNHPSGNLEPSRDDHALTRRLAVGAHVCGMKLHDHLVMALAGWDDLRGNPVWTHHSIATSSPGDFKLPIGIDSWLKTGQSE